MMAREGWFSLSKEARDSREMWARVEMFRLVAEDMIVSTGVEVMFFGGSC